MGIAQIDLDLPLSVKQAPRRTFFGPYFIIRLFDIAKMSKDYPGRCFDPP